MEKIDKKYIFISKIYDSREKNMTWHRAVFHGPERKADFFVTFYTSNTLIGEHNGQKVDISECLCREEMSTEQKKKVMKPYVKKEVYGFKDMLLHDIKGRYLWFISEYSVVDQSPMKQEDIRIYFPKRTWLPYLPEVYAERSESALFLERFLSIFQSLYEDLNEQIHYSPISFLPEVCDQKYLKVIAEWLGEQNDYLWTEDQLRYLLCHAMEFNQYRGTVKSLIELVSLYTGEAPYLVEHHQWEQDRQGKRKDILASLYEDNPYSFTLLVKEENVPNKDEYKTLLKILEEVIPAHMECRMVVIRPYIFLNSYSYLEINSMLGKYKAFDLSKVVIVPLSSINVKS